jgi:hypothetical protein
MSLFCNSLFQFLYFLILIFILSLSLSSSLSLFIIFLNSASELIEKREIAATTTLIPKPGTNSEGKVQGSLTYKIRYSPPELNGKIRANILKAHDLANADGVGVCFLLCMKA